MVENFSLGSQVSDRRRCCLLPPLSPRSGVTLRNQAATASRPQVATQAFTPKARTIPRNTMVGGACRTVKSPSRVSRPVANEAEPTLTSSNQTHNSSRVGSHLLLQRGLAPDEDLFVAVAKDGGCRH
ncbi:hypothetical protein MRX96_002241 [Rhipicephalus microplus]